jgi:hypothetical protein
MMKLRPMQTPSVCPLQKQCLSKFVAILVIVFMLVFLIVYSFWVYFGGGIPHSCEVSSAPFSTVASLLRAQLHFCDKVDPSSQVVGGTWGRGCNSWNKCGIDEKVRVSENIKPRRSVVRQ